MNVNNGVYEVTKLLAEWREGNKKAGTRPASG
jgi:hypothetical protein